MQPKLLATFTTVSRLVTFRLTREEFAEFNGANLCVGIICTLLAGIGRTLHNHRLEWWQHAGLGSVAYVFALSLLIYLVLAPLRVKGLSYRHILTFVSLTSPTGFIYAIPVERFMASGAAMETRFLFLALVATWRVALWIFYLKRYYRLPAMRTGVVSLLPLCGIVTALTILNLDKVVFNIMGGGQPSSDDGAYGFLLLVTFLSMWAFLPLLIAYIVLVVQAWRRRNAEPEPENPGSADSLSHPKNLAPG
jgi:hypothetical protein